MSKFAPPMPEESVVVNVVPLVDIMFLLLLFLMIGGDMSHRESTELQLPQADRATDQKTDIGKDEKYAIINIHSKRDAVTEGDREQPWYKALDNWEFAIQGVGYPDYWSLVDQLKVV